MHAGTDTSIRPTGFFSRGFRPFFLGAAALAGLAVPVWALAFSGFAGMPGGFASVAWHSHEMIFGYTGAVVAGFSLTAVPNWTGRLPIAGRALAGLFALWLLGRLAMALSPVLGPVVAGVLDGPFLVVLAGCLLREIVAGGNMRNLPIAGLVGVLALANVFWHVSLAADWETEPAQRAALAVVTVLIALVGGRVTPSFTHNWLMKIGRDAAMPGIGWIDKAALAATVAAMAAWTVAPDANWTGALLLAASAGLGLRLSRWRGWQTVSEPLVFILHVGYLWLVLAFAMLGVAAVGVEMISAATALHGLSAGAIGTMTLGVMTRASLGHTGMPLTANRTTIMIYALVTIGAVVRVLAGIYDQHYGAGVIVGGALWSGAFVLFVLTYGPRLIR